MLHCILVQGKRYFTCPPNHGIFVRQTQLIEYVEKEPAKAPSSSPNRGSPTTGLQKMSGLRKPGMSPLLKDMNKVSTE